MLAPIDFSRLSHALDVAASTGSSSRSSPCASPVAWAIDRKLEARARASEATRRHPRISGGVGRAVFSLVALVLLFIARPAFRAYGGTSLLHRHRDPASHRARRDPHAASTGCGALFADSAWLKTSERAIAFSIWGLVILYFVGVLPEVAHELDGIVLPFGASSVSLLTIAKGAASRSSSR